MSYDKHNIQSYMLGLVCRPTPKTLNLKASASPVSTG